MPEATTIPRITDEQLRAEVDEFAALTQQADAIKERLTACSASKVARLPGKPSGSTRSRPEASPVDSRKRRGR